MSDRDEIELHPAVGDLIITMRDEIHAHEATIAQLRAELADAAHSVAVERERCLSLLRAALIPTQPGARETNADRWWSQRIRDVLRAIEAGDENQTAAELIRHERERHAAELDELHALVARQAAILTGVANALRGPPGPLASHSHHDLAERAARVVRERDRASALNDEDATMIRELFAAVAERERWCDDRDATIAQLRSAIEARDASVREYLAAETSVAYALTDDSDAFDAAAMLARMHTVRTRRDEALARVRALVPP